VRSFLTAKDTEARLSEQPTLCKAGEDALINARIWVDASHRFQHIEGFGGAFTEAAASTWLKLGEEQQAQVLKDYFHPSLGHGYSLCRVHMGSCDFALGNYSHLETPNDVELTSFSIERDRQALIPFIKAAQLVATQPLKLLVSPWSPPAWMKSTGQMNGGGQLRPEFAATWALCFVRFIAAYAAEGIPIWGVTLQNEPQAKQTWDSCIYSAEEERDFIRDHLGPALHAAGMGQVRIIAWDHNRDEMVARASVIFKDAQAAQYVWGTGFHWYGEDHFDHVQLVHDAWPDKHLLFTEGCQEGGPHRGAWELGERYARSVINDLNRWTVGWIDWNLLLDERGGPNHVGNFCSAPLLAMRGENRIHKQSSYFYLGHFSRFIREGARRILCSANRHALECTAFANLDGSIAIVIMNRSDEPIPFQLHLNGQAWLAELPSRAIMTLLD
jgi:glucosylceramidase